MTPTSACSAGVTPLTNAEKTNAAVIASISCRMRLLRNDQSPSRYR